MMTDTKTDEIDALTKRLREVAGDAREGLPLEVFHLVSSLTPMINVDLLIRNDLGQTLLTWRADEFYGPGWHIPGGIIRFKESLTQRIAAVAAGELGCSVEVTSTPLVLREITAPHRDVRGHFISLLFACTLTSAPDPALKFGAGIPKNGQWMWHDNCPKDMIRIHEAYLPWIDNAAPPDFSCLQG